MIIKLKTGAKSASKPTKKAAVKLALGEKSALKPKSRKEKEKLSEVRVRQVMEQKGIKQSELAKMIGVGKSHITRIINGDRMCISLPIALKIAKALKTPLEKLFIVKRVKTVKK